MSFEQQLQEKREQRLKANGDFLKQLNKLTFGDFKKHESPNRRLIEQKTETVKHKKVLKRHDSLKKGIHYTVGVDKSYVIQQKQKIDYALAQRKPIEFIAKLDRQVVLQTKVKKDKSHYNFSEKATKRKIVKGAVVAVEEDK